ncbi:MAG: hypothetical protein KDN05_11640 [Verrucomicrobiae bacterium]|nr:hypothetical protein [Verrucomicrobiae bacterium]
MPRLIIHDERLGRSKEQVLTLDCLSEYLTVRELIRQRVYQEVGDYNQTRFGTAEKPVPNLLVTPTEMEARLNAKPSKIGPNREKAIDWEDQYELACRGFESNAFFVLIGDQQAESLEERFHVAVDTEITFVKLVPLVGG